MSNKFSCPVSMQVTQEQYEKDLRQGLFDLGYEEVNFTWSSYRCDILATNFEGISDEISNVFKGDNKNCDRYFIDHYNPELFLALAAMREGDEINVGEYMLSYGDGDLILVDEFCKITSIDDADDFSHGAFSRNYVKSCWRKATQEELINFLVKSNPLNAENIKQCPSFPSSNGETFTITLNEEHFAPQEVLDEMCEEFSSRKIVITIPYKEEYKEALDEFLNNPDQELSIRPGYVKLREDGLLETSTDPNQAYYVNPYNTTNNPTLENGGIEHSVLRTPAPNKPLQGFKDSEEKLNYELDWDFIEAMAKRMQKAKSKYGKDNWKKPLNPEQLKQAIFRHVMDVMRGKYEDDGSEFGGIEALACNAMMLTYQLKHNNKTNE